MGGGMYDQHPVFLQRMLFVISEQEKERKREEERNKRKESGPRPKNSSRGYH